MYSKPKIDHIIYPQYMVDWLEMPRNRRLRLFCSRGVSEKYGTPPPLPMDCNQLPWSKRAIWDYMNLHDISAGKNPWLVLATGGIFRPGMGRSNMVNTCYTTKHDENLRKKIMVGQLWSRSPDWETPVFTKTSHIKVSCTLALGRTSYAYWTAINLSVLGTKHGYDKQ